MTRSLASAMALVFACILVASHATSSFAQTSSPSPLPAPTATPTVLPMIIPTVPPTPLPASAQTASPVPTSTSTATATPTATSSAMLEDPVPNEYVLGQVLTIGHGFIVFTTGDALRLRAGTVVPKGTITGSAVRVTVDQLARDVKAIELEPRVSLAGEIQAKDLGRQYVVHAVIDEPAAPTTAAPPPVSSELVNVTLTADAPANTPLTDDVYLSTERSGFNPSELRMQRVDSRHFTTGLSIPLGSHLRYQFTRGSNVTVERERNGDISQPHDLIAAPNARIETTIARWADLN